MKTPAPNDVHDITATIDVRAELLDDWGIGRWAMAIAIMLSFF